MKPAYSAMEALKMLRKFVFLFFVLFISISAAARLPREMKKDLKHAERLHAQLDLVEDAALESLRRIEEIDPASPEFVSIMSEFVARDALRDTCFAAFSAAIILLTHDWGTHPALRQELEKRQLLKKPALDYSEEVQRVLKKIQDRNPRPLPPARPTPRARFFDIAELTTHAFIYNLQDSMNEEKRP